ncbi:GEM-like protein 5, partial [Cucurbita argyrosperma subsp. sororia]
MAGASEHPKPTESQASPVPPPSTEEESKKWGTHVMGPPAAPSEHPDNHKAAFWNAADQQKIHHHPYVQYSPMDHRPSTNPFEPVVHAFNSWSNKAETMARNIWHNLRTGPSMSEAAWGKLNLTAKAITEGGFESLFKQTFATEPNEKLMKSFACYLSTATGPVAGTLYLSTVMIPLSHIPAVNPVTMPGNPSARYLQITTVDGHEFWFMGFVNFEKATHHLLNAVSVHNAPPFAA